VANLLSNITSYTDRVFINTEKTKNFIENNNEIKDILKNAVSENKNLLLGIN